MLLLLLLLLLLLESLVLLPLLLLLLQWCLVVLLQHGWYIGLPWMLCLLERRWHASEGCWLWHLGWHERLWHWLLPAMLLLVLLLVLLLLLLLVLVLLLLLLLDCTDSCRHEQVPHGGTRPLHS